MALNRQVWEAQIKEGFYPDASFLNFMVDMSASVNANRIHVGSAGIDPIVLINNTTYPIPYAERADDDNEIPLDTFSTTNIRVGRPETIEYSYNQLESVIRQHRNTLLKACSTKAAHAIAPNANTAQTPVLQTTGATVGTRKRLCFDDILNLKDEFDNADFPTDGRILVLHPTHVSDLLREDLKLFKEITNLVDGKPNRFGGFHCLSFSKMPTYTIQNDGTLKKVAFGDEETERYCSFAYLKDEVMKADGEIHMYSRVDDPQIRGTLIGFDKRFISMPIRGIGVGSIVSAQIED